MKRIYEESDIRAKGNIVPLSRFRPFLDFGELTPDEKYLDELVKIAEGMLDEEIPLLPLSLYRTYFKTGDRSEFDQKYLRRRYMLAVMTYAEYREKKGRFTEKICDLIFAILEESTWVLHAHTFYFVQEPCGEVPDVYLPEHLHGIDLRAAMTGTILTLTYYLCRDSLDKISPIIAKRLKYTVLDRIVKPYLAHTFPWPLNNWQVYIVSSVLFVTAFLEEDTEKREAVAERAMVQLDDYIATYPEDGGCDEGAGYWSAASGAYFDVAELIFDMSGGKIDIFSTPDMRKLGEFEPRMYISGSRFINFADCSPIVHCDGKLIHRFGVRVGSAEMTGFGKLLANKARAIDENAFSFSMAYRSLKNAHFVIAKENSVPALSTDAWFENLKIAVFRENSNATGTLAAIKGGHNAESHNHNDLGSFVIYSDGMPVIIDAGSGVYTKKTFSEERYSIWNMQSEYHNLPVFGGIGQKDGAEFASRDEKFNEEAHSAEMELSGAYPEDAGVVEYKRSLSLCGSEVDICDVFTLNSAKEVEFRFLTTEKPSLIESGKLSLPAGRALVYDPTLTFEAVRVVTESYDPKKLFDTDALWQIRLKTTTNGGKFEFKII